MSIGQNKNGDKELAFSFFECAPAPQGPQISIKSEASDGSEYALIASAARDFRGWLTVTAYAVIRKAARTYRRSAREPQMLFRRRLTLCAGGLRL